MFSYPNFYVVMPSNDSAINNVAGVYNVINKSWGTAAGIYATYTTSYNDRKARACFGSAVTS